MGAYPGRWHRAGRRAAANKGGTAGDHARPFLGGRFVFNPRRKKDAGKSVLQESVDGIEMKTHRYLSGDPSPEKPAYAGGPDNLKHPLWR